MELLRENARELLTDYLIRVARRYNIPLEELTSQIHITPREAERHQLCVEEKYSDAYNPVTDNLSFEELHRAGFVTSEKGEIKKVVLTESEISTLSSIPVYSVQHIVLKQQHPSFVGEVYLGVNYYDVVKSNLQKMIRRGKVLEACRSAYEMYQMGKLAGRFRSNLMNRLTKVILSEDLGIASSYLIRDAYQLIQAVEREEKGPEEKGVERGTEEKGPLPQDSSETILPLLFRYVAKACHSQKSRLCDYLYISYWVHRSEGVPITTRSWSESLNAFRTALQKKDLPLSLSYMRHLEQTVGSVPMIRDPFLGNHRKSVYTVWQILIDLSPPNVKELNQLLFKIYETHTEHTLNLIHALLNIVLNEQTAWEEPQNIHGVITPSVDEVVNSEVVPDPVSYDCHTRVGRKLRKNHIDFYLYGCKITNKRPELEALERKYYNLCYRACFEVDPTKTAMLTSMWD